MRMILGESAIGPDVSPMLLDPEEEEYLTQRAAEVLEELEVGMEEIEQRFAA